MTRSDPGLETDDCTSLDRFFAVPMFVVATLFLLTTGALLHLTAGDLTSPLARWLLTVLGILYVFIVAEFVVQWRSGARNLRQHISYLLMPVMRLCPRDHRDGSHAWVPGFGWRKTTPRLEKFLARVFSGPMIVIALLVLPVIAIEFFYADSFNTHPQRKFIIDTCSGFIWMAFVFEFVVMISVVEKRWRYCKKNWIDLAVVLLPLVSFMGAARLGRLVKLKQLTRTAKIYRMRGLLLRSWRAIVALDVIDALLRRDTEQRMEKLERMIEEKELEISHLRSEIERIQTRAAKAAEKKAAAGKSPSDDSEIDEAAI